MSFLKEFKEFAVRGNMVDMAVGIVIGGAFGTIVSSLVNDVFTPILGLMIGGIDFANLFIVLSNPSDTPVTTLLEAQEAGAATLNVGLFLNAIIQFTIVAFALFLLVKGINTLRRQEAAKPEAAKEIPAPPREEVLLTEIRDLLKTR
ncbi:large conductance mechanosensitive channel protein MscL [Pelagibacterium montanilacus]|uniref:large conductance mechanosensitive channel protein MscL n=1 Tax=Pelagibacterium montanilacus TaxID=2185280 RepID=UPI000F8C7653|nr:large conductance mechanosensitive channel protein MscL [Pelagibacterium montanilacus]